jgi:hypothetical protein
VSKQGIRRFEVHFAWTLLVVSLCGWPVSAMTWAKDEPATVLGLSWLAITLTALDFLKTARVHRDQTEGES